jgi:siroheme synthase (precorrin-2 oxidase/ferrochelatase)
MQQATNDTDQMNYVIAAETLKETAQEFNTVIRSAEKLINTADLPESVQPIYKKNMKKVKTNWKSRLKRV